MTKKYYREYAIQQQLPLKYHPQNKLIMYIEPKQLKIDFTKKPEKEKPSQLELKFE